MSTVRKYPLPIAKRTVLGMPRGAKVLCVQSQFGSALCLWVWVDPAQPQQDRAFRVIATDQPLDETHGLSYLGTAQTSGGALVWHAFEEDAP